MLDRIIGKDRQYSIAAITNSSGDLVERYEYTAFGLMTIFDNQDQDITDTGSTIGNPYGYTGRRWDAQTGLWYYRNRMYSPTIGRFMQRDPTGYVDGANLYAYVKNRPLVYLDPWGLTAQAPPSDSVADGFVDSWANNPYADVGTGSDYSFVDDITADTLSTDPYSGSYFDDPNQILLGGDFGSDLVGTVPKNGSNNPVSQASSNPLPSLPTFSESFPQSNFIAPVADIVSGGIEAGFATAFGIGAGVSFLAGPEFWPLTIMLGPPSIAGGWDAYGRIRTGIQRVGQP